MTIIYESEKLSELPEKVAKELVKYVAQHGQPPYPIEIKIVNGVVVINEFSMKETS